MKHKIKKNRLKIFIALSLIITCVFGVMFATNTFAYNNNYATLTNTLDLNTIVTGQYNESTTIKSNNGNNNIIYQYIEVQHNSQSSINMSFGVNLKNDLNYNNDNGNYIALINLEYGYYNNNNVWTTYTGTSNYLTTYVGNNTTTLNYGTQTRTSYYSQNDFGYNYKSTIIQLYNNNYYINFSNTIYFNFRLPSTISSTQYSIRIYNIDIVSNNEVYTQQYIDTYYAPLEDQYDQLLEDYNTLEDNYETLNDNYTQLENDYNELEENYNTLENQYDELDEKFKNLYFNTNYGIWNFLSYENITIENPSYSANNEYYTYDGITNWVKNDNILEQNKLNITNAITRYWNPPLTPPYTINCDLWYIDMYFSVPNNVNYIYYELPIDTLDLQIDTNINFNEYEDENTTNYIVFNIRLNNYENYSYGNHIDLILTKEFLDKYGYNITKENLQNEFTQYDLNYYNNIMQINVFSNHKLNTEDKFNIISTNAVIDRNYQLGFADGRASMNNTITELKNNIANLNGRLNQYEREINILNGQIDTLENDEYSLNNLMWTIGSVPFESFKQIWNVNFFGVNLADFFLGFVTFFIALFVVKKFFL